MFFWRIQDPVPPTIPVPEPHCLLQHRCRHPSWSASPGTVSLPVISPSLVPPCYPGSIGIAAEARRLRTGGYQRSLFHSSSVKNEIAGHPGIFQLVGIKGSQLIKSGMRFDIFRHIAPAVLSTMIKPPEASCSGPGKYPLIASVESDGKIREFGHKTRRYAIHVPQVRPDLLGHFYAVSGICRPAGKIDGIHLQILQKSSHHSPQNHRCTISRPYEP